MRKLVKESLNEENTDKLYTIEEIMDALRDISLFNPYHIRMTSDGGGEFPDGYILTKEGAEELTETLKDALK